MDSGGYNGIEIVSPAERRGCFGAEPIIDSR